MDDTNRRTIFVPLSGGCKISLVVGDFSVNDGDGTTSYSVFARALGTPGGSSVVSDGS